MTYVFVLTSTEKDLYYEQCLMAAYSFRLYNKWEKLVVLVDNKTNDSFTEENKRTALKEYADIISIPFDETVTNAERSRLIKTSIPDYVDDDFLYMDCDMIICDSLDSIKNEDCNLGGVLDCHEKLDRHIHRDYFLKRDKNLGFHGTKALNGNFNGGLVFARKGDDQKLLFKEWNRLWRYSSYEKKDRHDQPSLNEANYLTGMKMKELSGIWNCQLAHGGLGYLEDAKILHYFSSEFDGKNYVPYYKLADCKLQLRIKEAGFIPDDIKKMIKNAKFQFNSVHIVSDRRIVCLMQSPLLFTLAEIKQKFPHVYKFLEFQTSIFRKMGKKLVGKK